MSALIEKDLKAIIARRDRRYDGRFYFGVRTTKIYCRPVCPARPKPENIRIFRSHSEAEKNGFRPCLRCRPDVAPGSKFFDGTMNTVTRALRLIQNATDGDLTVESLAASLGVTDRHLRRLFDEHLGASPIEIMVTQRLHFAKQALQETTLPVAEIAFSSGFQSLRRFNEAFKNSYHISPTAFRSERGTATKDMLTLKLPIRLPYDWATMIAFLDRHTTYGVELVEAGCYRRFIPTERGLGSVVVAHVPGKDHLTATFQDVPVVTMRFVLTRLKFLFDTDHNPSDLPRAVGIAANGIRVPGSFEPFETSVSIILGQLVSTAQAKLRVKKLVEAFGTAGRFPTPETLMAAQIEAIGVTKMKGEAIRALAKAVATKAIDFSSAADFAVTTAKLLALRGVGPWTAELIAMRCLGSPDAFPKTDLIIQRAVEKGLADVEAWGSAKSYLTHCLWRDFAGVKA